MKVGIMQPYFMPYIGYFQLIHAVDTYVIYDDVNFIKGGWINRNRILLNGDAFLINLPMLGASPYKKINEIEIGSGLDKVLKTITQAYRKSKYYDQVMPLLENICSCESSNLADFLANSIIEISNYLKLNTKFVLSSEINKNNDLKGQDKVINICKVIGATDYYNAIGGIELYNKQSFANENIELRFLKPSLIEYVQFKNDFIPGLSIIDVMMYNSVEEINTMLDNFELV